jgi:hypothetical protein
MKHADWPTDHGAAYLDLAAQVPISPGRGQARPL